MLNFLFVAPMEMIRVDRSIDNRNWIALMPGNVLNASIHESGIGTLAYSVTALKKKWRVYPRRIQVNDRFRYDA